VADSFKVGGGGFAINIVAPCSLWAGVADQHSQVSTIDGVIPKGRTDALIDGRIDREQNQAR